MPIVARELTEVELRALVAPGTHAVGGVTGLCLQITSTGAKSWLLRITANQRRREFGLGAFPTVTLSRAREKARALREKVGSGADPVLQRRAASAARRVAAAKEVTFKACAEAYVAAELNGGRNARHAARVLQELQRYAFPALERRDVRAITAEIVLSILQPLWTTKFATATKLRGHIERVLRFGIASGFRNEPNPARWTGNLDAMLPAPKAARSLEHHPSLPPAEIPAFFADLRTMPGVAARALEVMIMTATRPANVRSMTWDQLDLQGAVWVLPSDTAQADKRLTIHLPKPVLDLLTAQPPGAANGPVFAAPRSGEALSDMTLTAVIRRLNAKRLSRGQQPWGDPTQDGREVVPLGFRSTFRAWAQQQYHADDGYEQETRASQPSAAHSKAASGSVSIAQMAAWCNHCVGHGSLSQKRRR